MMQDFLLSQPFIGLQHSGPAVCFSSFYPKPASVVSIAIGRWMLGSTFYVQHFTFNVQDAGIPSPVAGFKAQHSTFNIQHSMFSLLVSFPVFPGTGDCRLTLQINFIVCYKPLLFSICLFGQ